MERPICHKFEEASNILSKRWVGLIVHQLLLGPKRFNTLQQEVALSGKVLSQRLKELESLNIVSRTIYDETPVRIEYALTHKGKALEPVLNEIEKWSQSWIE